MNEQHPSPTAIARRPRLLVLGATAALLLTAGAGTGAWALTSPGDTDATTAAQAAGPEGPGRGFSGPGGGSRYGGGAGSDSARGGSAAVDSTTADAAQMVGVVTIDTELQYQGAMAAGTGIVLTSTGRILTNHHVIAGATSIHVTVESTGRSYTADVVGSSASDDVAVLQLQGASGLTTATIASDDAAIGDAVTAVGNANGTGTLTAAEGTVTDVGARITTQSEGSAEGETLTGLIETSADVVSGDSGGPLKDADGAVVGIDTAASSGSADITGYAIPIDTALSVAAWILAGDDTDGIVIGSPAFLGVALSADDTTDGALLEGAYEGTPAADAGLAGGDTITAVDGTEIHSSAGLSSAISGHAPGDRVRITWLDESGDSHTATVTLTDGPAA